MKPGDYFSEDKKHQISIPKKPNLAEEEKQEGKMDSIDEGEGLGYSSLAQARLLAKKCRPNTPD